MRFPVHHLLLHQTQLPSNTNCCRADLCHNFHMTGNHKCRCICGNSLGVISKVHTSRTNERTFIWEGGGLDPIRCAIDSEKKKKKKKKKKKRPRPSTDRAAALADKSKSPIKCRKSLRRDLKQVQAKKAEGACMRLQSIHRRCWLAFEGQVEGNGRHSLQFDTVELHQLPAFKPCGKGKKVEIVFLFDCSRLSSCSVSQWMLNLQGSIPAWDRQHCLGRLWGRNEDRVDGHLQYITPIVDHTFVWGGREGVKCHMKVLSFVRNVRTFETTPYVFEALYLKLILFFGKKYMCRCKKCHGGLFWRFSCFFVLQLHALNRFLGRVKYRQMSNFVATSISRAVYAYENLAKARWACCCCC